MASRMGIWMSVVVGAAAAISLAAPGAAAQQLSVGAAAGTRYQLSRADGEAQLHHLARSATTEEAWLLAGDVWIVIGYQERRSAVSVDLSVVTSAVEVAGAGKPLAFYHLHPFHEDPRAIEPPSVQDVQSLALMKELYGPVTGVVFDGRGKWTFDITAEQAARVRATETADYATSHGYGRRDPAFLFDRSYPLIAWDVNSSPGGRDDRIRGFIESARELGVTVTYTPIVP